ncbi:hypothetical protein CJ030_MR8G021780 [Morella rubra]|uniref:Uncharacterized protein n=1 Tax=Morella rubra TaxID=262757 RepID=A0A6A1UXN8_9ROSI|nr:hypothetical protein CJ030_MR8G021780 [Morella rubra]
MAFGPPILSNAQKRHSLKLDIGLGEAYKVPPKFRIIGFASIQRKARARRDAARLLGGIVEKLVVRLSEIEILFVFHRKRRRPRMAYGACYLKGTRFFDRGGMIAGVSFSSRSSPLLALCRGIDAASLGVRVDSAPFFHIGICLRDFSVWRDGRDDCGNNRDSSEVTGSMVGLHSAPEGSAWFRRSGAARFGTITTKYIWIESSYSFR